MQGVNPPFRLDGERALITGGGTGLGFGIARCFVESGATVVLAGRRQTELRNAAQALGSAAHFVPHDVTHLDRAEQLVQRASDTAGGPISILVNNAGISLKKSAVQTTSADFELMLRTHVLGAHALARAALPGMIEHRHGSILFMASMTSFLGVPLVHAYSAAKSAVLGMVRSLAAESGTHGVRVNAIAPGWIETPMLQQALNNDPQRQEKILGRTMLDGFGDPADIGWAAVYLCSPAARFVTGVILPIDGGASVGF